ncbi:MAG TPA: GNAT family N-acetyltransferase [Micromonosporaceae bacterium]|nr:GNAT family N-acetyltransferase [Micromonosporaceae bacterium]
MTETAFDTARFADLDTKTLYALLKLRVDVFVVEQRCPYPELDGRDWEPDALHVWGSRHGVPVGYVRLVQDPDGMIRIGRVCTARDARGQGLAGQLMTRALAEVGERPCRLDAQSHLLDFYAGYGFAPAGPEFLDDGIPHVPMTRPAMAAPR